MDEPGQRADAGEGAGLGPDDAGRRPRCAPLGSGRRACRTSRRPAAPASTRAQPRRRGRRPAAARRPGSPALTRSPAASPLPSTHARRRRRRRAARRTGRIAAAAPVNEAGCVLGERDLPAQALGDDVVRVLQHLLDERAERRRRAPSPSMRGAGRRRARATTGRSRPAERARPARGRRRGPGCALRVGVGRRGPAAVGHHRGDRRRRSSLGHVLGRPGRRDAGPVNSESSTTMRVGRTCARAQLRRQVADPRGAGVGGRVARPRRRSASGRRRRRARRAPPRAGDAPWCVMRSVGAATDSTAAAVSSLAVDAGAAGTSRRRGRSSTGPVVDVDDPARSRGPSAGGAGASGRARAATAAAPARAAAGAGAGVRPAARAAAPAARPGRGAARGAVWPGRRAGSRTNRRSRRAAAGDEDQR